METPAKLVKHQKTVLSSLTMVAVVKRDLVQQAQLERELLAGVVGDVDHGVVELGAVLIVLERIESDIGKSADSETSGRLYVLYRVSARFSYFTKTLTAEDNEIKAKNREWVSSAIGEPLEDRGADYLPRRICVT